MFSKFESGFDKQVQQTLHTNCIHSVGAWGRRRNVKGLGTISFGKPQKQLLVFAAKNNNHEYNFLKSQKSCQLAVSSWPPLEARERESLYHEPARYFMHSLNSQLRLFSMLLKF